MDVGRDRVERVLEKRKDKIETKDGKKREWRPSINRVFGLGLIKRESEDRVRILRKDEEDRIEKEKKDKEGETSSTDSAPPTP